MFKYVEHPNNEGILPLCIVIPQITLYTNYINISANEKEFLKYIEIWDKIKNLFKNLFNKMFDSEPIYNNEFIRTKINLFKAMTDLKKMNDYSIILIESICVVNDNYYPQAFLEKYFKEHNNPIN